MTYKNILFIITILLASVADKASAQDFYAAQRAGWLEKAELYKPELMRVTKNPVRFVDIVKDKDAFQGWKVIYGEDIGRMPDVSLKEKKSYIIDFGEHITGYFSFSLSPMDLTPDSPVRIKFTFGEVPSEMMVPFDPYNGTISRAWLQDEVVTVMTVPGTTRIDRRLSFRYVKVELVAAPNYNFAISDMVCEAVTSARVQPAPLPQYMPDIVKKIDEVGLNTLKECMQTVYEDGPKRDQRLWIGDLYLEAMANSYSFKQHNLTQRCLYLLAALSDENGFLNATVFERPQPHPQAKQFLLEYAFLFNATLKDYLETTNDLTTANDLWIVAKKQMDIVHSYLQSDGLMDYERANREWWIFIDWKEGLHKEVALQGVSVFALKETYRLAQMLGREKEVAEYPALIKRMTDAARKHYYDKKTGLFAGIENKQLSYASQIWMVLGGIVSPNEARKTLQALQTVPDVHRPGTPYLYHYYIQALIDAGMKTEAKKSLIDFWGGMIDKGADTFWEAYDPQDDFISPYNFYPMNSYCHAWSCTPVYFIRKYPEIFR